MTKKPDTESRILEILKKNPRGLNIREISGKSGVNRISVAKYLEVLTASGMAEVRSLGNAKVYYLSRHLPPAMFLQHAAKNYCIADSDLKIVQINPPVAGIPIKMPDEIIGTSLPDTLRPGIVNFDECMGAMERALAGEETSLVADEYWEGRHRFFEVCFMPVQFPDGSCGVMAISENITARKLAEIDLRRKEERYRDLVENVPDVVFSLDTTGALSYISPRVAEYGFVPDQLLGREYVRFILPEDLPLVREQFRVVAVTGGTHRGIRFRVAATDGQTIWMETDLLVRTDAFGSCTGVNGILRDVTEQLVPDRNETVLHAFPDDAGGSVVPPCTH